MKHKAHAIPITVCIFQIIVIALKLIDIVVCSWGAALLPLWILILSTALMVVINNTK